MSKNIIATLTNDQTGLSVQVCEIRRDDDSVDYSVDTKKPGEKEHTTFRRYVARAIAFQLAQDLITGKVKH